MTGSTSFPALRVAATCNYLNLWLVCWIVCVLCDWSEWFWRSSALHKSHWDLYTLYKSHSFGRIPSWVFTRLSPVTYFPRCINNSLHLSRKYAGILVRRHYLLREENSFPRAKEQIMSKVKYPSIVSRQMGNGEISPGAYSRVLPVFAGAYSATRRVKVNRGLGKIFDGL